MARRVVAARRSMARRIVDRDARASALAEETWESEGGATVSRQAANGVVLVERVQKASTPERTC